MKMKQTLMIAALMMLGFARMPAFAADYVIDSEKALSKFDDTIAADYRLSCSR